MFFLIGYRFYMLLFSWQLISFVLLLIWYMGLCYLVLFVLTKLSILFLFTAPVVVSEPIAAPAHQSSNSTSPSPSNKGKHSNLILIFGISAGILVFAIISVLIICSCTFREGKTKAAPKEPGMCNKRNDYEFFCWHWGLMFSLF